MSAPNSRLAALFVVIVVVLVGGAAVTPYVAGSDGGPDQVTVENQQFQPRNILADQLAEEGSITMDSQAETKTVLVDVGHENAVSKSELEPMLSTLVENGHRVRYYRGQRASLNESLRSADAFLVVNPRQRYSGDELAGLQAFTDAGGRVLLLGDPPTVQVTGGLLVASVQPVSSKTSALGSNYGVAYGSGYLYNMERNDNNFKSVFARPTDASGVADGVDRVVLREAAPIRTGDATRLLVGSDGTHLSSTRDPGEYAVAVRSGNVVAVGDSDFVARENAFDADNEVLIGNLADFLVDGEKEPGAPAEPSADAPQRPPASGPQGASSPPRTPTPA